MDSHEWIAEKPTEETIQQKRLFLPNKANKSFRILRRCSGQGENRAN